MKHTLALITVFSVVSASFALAAPRDASKPDAKKPAAKTKTITDVWTCPVQGEKIADHKTEAGKPQVVGNYRVHFCCAGCDSNFAKLSAKEKLAKAEAAYKKDVAKSDAGDKKGKS